jgi:hypothetical protein
MSPAVFSLLFSFSIFFFVVLGFELRPSHLLGRHSTTSSSLVIFKIKSHILTETAGHYSGSDRCAPECPSLFMDMES